MVKNEELLRSYGVETRNVNGELKNTYQTLVSLKPIWDKLGTSEKMALGTALAGSNQYKILSATLSQMNVAQRTYQEALMSSGETMKQNEVFMSGLEAHTNALKAEFEKLVLGEGGLQDFAKTIVDIGTKVLKFANSDIGQLTLSLTTLLVTLNLVKSLVANGTIGTLMEQAMLGGLASTKIGSFNVAIKQLTTSFLENATAWMATPMGAFTTAIVGVTSIFAIMNHFSESISETNEKLNELSDNYDEQSNKVDGLKSRLQGVIDEIRSFNDLDKLEVTDERQLQLLKEEEASLKRQILLEEYKRELAKKELEDEAKGNLSKKITVGYSNYNIYGEKYTSYQEYENPEVALQKYIEKYQSQVNQLKDLQKEAESYINPITNEVIKGTEEAYETAMAKIEKKEERIKLLFEDSSDLVQLVEKIVSSLELPSDNPLVILLDQFYKLSGVTEQVSSEVGENFGDLNEEETALTDTQEELVKETQKLIDKLSLSATTIDKLKQSFETLNKATEEMNSSQGLSVETYEALMNMGSNYVNALFDEEGALRSTADAQRELYKAKIDEMAISQARLLIDSAKSYYETKQSLEGYTVAIKEATGNTWDLVYSELADLTVKGEDTSAIHKQIDQYKLWSEMAKDNIDTMTSSTKATKEHNKALNESIKALKEEVKEYETAIKYINSKLDEQINKLKEEKKTQTDNISKQISLLKEQKDAESDYWDKKINALKEQNDALKDQLQYEELLENLAKAKSSKVKVYREGQGFVYETNLDEVTKAQQQLDEYNQKKKYEDELALLEQSKKDKLENYEKQIKDLEHYKDTLEENYDAQIKIFENYKEQFSKQADSYEEEQGRLLASQLLGIDMEQSNWTTRLSNLSEFVSKYNAKLAELNRLEEQSSNTTDDTQKTPKQVWIFKGKEYATQQEAYNAKQLELEKSKYLPTSVYNSIKSMPITSKSYASGISSIKEDQIAVVGENPNKEIVLGSKANGLLVGMDKGSGVVNAKSTKTLAGLLNQIGSYALQSFNEPTLASQMYSNSNDTIMNIANVNVQANDANDFINSMAQFKLRMTQKSYAI